VHLPPSEDRAAGDVPSQSAGMTDILPYPAPRPIDRVMSELGAEGPQDEQDELRLGLDESLAVLLSESLGWAEVLPLD
jgi:hypothetical protein